MTILPGHGTSWWRARRNESAQDVGASAVEYGLIVFAIAAVIVGVVVAFGHVVHDTYSTTCSGIADATNTSADCTS